MNNQTSIKYITALLENPQTITDGDQSSIALFRQTFPYFIPARYLVALESHKKSPYTPKMLTAIQPYLGDWIRFCEFLDAGNKAVGELASVNKVTDKKKVDIQPEPEALVSPIPAVKEEQKLPEPMAPVVVPEEVKPVQPEIIVAKIPPVPQIIVAEEEIISVLPEAIVSAAPVAPEIEAQPEMTVPEPPVVAPVAEFVTEQAWPTDKDAAPVVIPPDRKSVV